MTLKELAEGELGNRREEFARAVRQAAVHCDRAEELVFGNAEDTNLAGTQLMAFARAYIEAGSDQLRKMAAAQFAESNHLPPSEVTELMDYLGLPYRTTPETPPSH